MSTALTHALFVLVPLGLTFVLVALIWRHKGPHPATYKMSEPWKHAPILWASEEPAGHGHAGHGSHPVAIGGGASGKW
ncbi:hypothetical protein ABGB19_19000 [Mycobacterium sp. B14F4]|uniref:aa3-type cytochrome oxidase subunit CtaJ n=1 Tax=Mycobacterium sp. B14F4 TaxID=3153565 RepID=UPI00325D2CF1